MKGKFNIPSFFILISIVFFGLIVFIGCSFNQKEPSGGNIIADHTVVDRYDEYSRRVY